MFQVEFPAGCEVRCPGCNQRGWGYEKSENQKIGWIQSRLKPWLEWIEPLQGVRDSGRWGYRRKTCLHAEWREDHWAFGLLVRRPQGPMGSYDLIDIPECPIHAASVRKIVQILSKRLPSQEQLPLAYLAVSGTLVTLVVKSKRLPELPHLNWAELGITGLFVNLNPAAGNRVYSNRGWHLVWGADHAVEDGFQYGPDSFQQLIPALHGHALQEAARFLNVKSGDAVIDLCSGTGRSLSIWKNLGAHFLGVELSGDAIRCSEVNIGPDSCLRGRVSERLPQLESWVKKIKPHQLFMYANPPRLGLEDQVTSWIAQIARPERIAYLSCSPQTLSRDLSVLTQSGYAVQRIIPYDFFPQTHHVETLALLAKNESDSSRCLSGSVDSRFVTGSK